MVTYSEYILTKKQGPLLSEERETEFDLSRDLVASNLLSCRGCLEFSSHTNPRLIRGQILPHILTVRLGTAAEMAFVYYIFIVYISGSALGEADEAQPHEERHLQRVQRRRAGDLLQIRE